MKITKNRLKQIIKEEYHKIMELGPATGHEEGTDPLKALQEVIAGLAEVADIMEKAPSHTTPGEYSGFIRSTSEELQDIINEIDAEAGRNPGGTIGEGYGEDYDKKALENAIYALEHLKDEKIEHLNLKPENILAFDNH